MDNRISSPTHASPSPSGEDLRAEAQAFASRRQATSQLSQTAFHSGRRADAKQLSDEAKIYGAECDRLHALAEAAIFAAKNRNYPATLKRPKKLGFLERIFWGSDPVDETEIKKRLARLDLHGLFVAEALARVDAHMEGCKEWGVGKTLVITGRGAHSQGGVAKIKPGVERWLAERSGEMGVVYGNGNLGAIEVELVAELVAEEKGWASGILAVFGW